MIYGRTSWANLMGFNSFLWENSFYIFECYRYTFNIKFKVKVHKVLCEAILLRESTWM